MFDTVVLQDLLHGREADLVDRIHHPIVNQADTFEACVRCSLHTILEGKWADFAWAHRVNIAGNCPVGRQQFNVLSSHLESSVSKL
ncbi:hypothetical protein D3C75_1214440 [compost metagenome]